MTRHYSVIDLRGRFMRRLKDYGLSLSILIGIVGYRPLSTPSPVISYMLMLTLFSSFLKLTPRDLRICPVHFLLQFIQIVLAVGGYLLVRYSSISESTLLAEGLMICFFYPAASASPVVIGFLEGNVALGTTYVLLTNVGVIALAPLLLGFFDSGAMDYGATFVQVFYRVLPVTTPPLLLVWAVRYGAKPAYRVLSKIPSVSFQVWLLSLSPIMANTVYFIAEEPREMIPTMILLGVMGLIACIVQFVLGKWLSKQILGESIMLGQSLGQKNSIIAIQLAQSHLSPLPSAAMATYSIQQSLLNAYQIHQATKHSGKKQS